MKKWTETDLEKRLAYIKKSAWQHAGEQMNIAEMYLRKHPGENAAFDSAPASLHDMWERSWISDLRTIAGRSI